MKNLIKNIKDGKNLDEYINYVRQVLFVEGSTSMTVVEIISYLKLFQPEFLSKHENDILELMGLYFKKPTPNTMEAAAFAVYGEYIQNLYGEPFTPIQADILQNINTLKTFSFSAPTSTGKSFVFRELIKNATYDVAVIVPSRALINEYYDKILEVIKTKDINVLTFVEIINTKHSKHNIFILTPERARELFKQKNRLNLGLVLFDEAQLSDEDSVRGLYFDSIVRRVQKNFPESKCVFAHPFISNPEAQLKKNNLEICELYNASHYEQKNVGQIFYSHDKSSSVFYHFGSDKKLMGNHKLPSNFDPIYESLINNGSVLIYTHKSHIYSGEVFKDFQKYIKLCTEITNEEALQLINKFKAFTGANDSDDSEYVSQIVEFMKKGIVIHHGSMPLKARVILEHFTQKGFCKICFATSTLEQGINMPFDIVYLDKYEPSKALSVKNLIGRAGRSTIHNSFDFGAIIIKDSTERIRSLRKVINTPEQIDEISNLDKEDDRLDEKYQEYKEAIKNDQFNDEYNLTNSDVQKLSNQEIHDTVTTLLDLMFDENEELIYPKWESEEKNDRRAMYDDFHSLYRNYLGGRQLETGEKSVLSQAIKIMIWQVHSKTFKHICQHRYDYVVHKKDRKKNANIDTKKEHAKFLCKYADIPDKSMKAISLFHGKSISEVEYDLIIYDTYDYLDKLIGFKLSDIYYAIFHQYYKTKGDYRALKLSNYIKYGTNTHSEIWMLKYGLTFEDIEWAKDCIENINEEEIIFNSKYNELEEDNQNILSRYYHDSSEIN